MRAGVRSAARHLRGGPRPHRAIDWSPLPAAAFVHDGVLVRADVTFRDGGVWNLVEVKSSTKAKPEHVTDAAIQTYVVEGAGLTVGKAFVGHLDKTYVYSGGDYDLNARFALDDVTDAVTAYLPSIPAKIADRKAHFADTVLSTQDGVQVDTVLRRRPPSRVGTQPVTQGIVQPRLPSTACCLERTQHVCVQADVHVLLWVRGTRSPALGLEQLLGSVAANQPGQNVLGRPGFVEPLVGGFGSVLVDEFWVRLAWHSASFRVGSLCAG